MFFVVYLSFCLFSFFFLNLIETGQEEKKDQSRSSTCKLVISSLLLIKL